ncbi:MAG: carboxypeptidase-like regulatory domain-containing protein [Gammaproteobacteria bacterium]|nr:carboxypeptidase-like regulatory domain-containing protein [Gammaproteobacteria bacterium]MDH3507280.1 carboxypeptidase-like regulatory domain-containing protein [Gammaproteobacteria bacterium]
MTVPLRSVGSSALLTAFILAFAPIGSAQPGSSGLSGLVLDFTGAPVADAPIRARNDAASVDARTRSNEDGSYDFADLLPGTYTVSVAMSCCAYLPFRRNDIVLASGAPLKFDIALEEGLSLNTLGDDPETMISEVRDRQVIPDEPVPRTADGHPDLTGVWLRSEDPYPEPPNVLAWAAEAFAERAATDFVDNPTSFCLPGSPPAPGGASFVVKFVQRPELLLILLEGAPYFRQIFLDGRQHPDLEEYDPTWMGHSIGRWEGDTLVVDTVGFNDRGWIGPYPRTEAMRTVERYTRTDYGSLELQFVVEDPNVFSEPWVQNMTWDLAPQEELFETVCENNKWAQ